MAHDNPGRCSRSGVAVSSLIFIFASIVGLNVRANSITDLLPVTVAYPEDGVVLGQGYDMVLMQKRPISCVQGVSQLLNGSGLTISYSDVFDTEQIFDSLKVNVSASANFGAGSGSASASYAQSVTINHDRRNILATVDGIAKGEQLAPTATTGMVAPGQTAAVTLTNLGTQLAKKAQQFRSACGDGYVAAIRYGAKLQMVFSYAMDSKDVNQQTSGSIGGSAGPFSAQAAVSAVHSDQTKTIANGYTIFQVSGTSPTDKAPPFPTDVASAITYFQTFGSFGLGNPVPVEIVVRPYTEIQGIPDSILSQPLPDSGVRNLALHYRRLAALSAIYADSYNSPQSYYHPFVEMADEANIARRLQFAANCVAAMTNVCARSGVCQMSELLKLAGKSTYPEMKKSCVVLSTDQVSLNHLSSKDAAEILKLTVGSPQKDESGTQPASQTTDSLIETNAMKARVTSKASIEADSWWNYVHQLKLDSDPTPYKGLVLKTPYDVYLAYLARSPWTKYQANSSGSSELPTLVNQFCSNIGGTTCPGTDMSGATTNGCRATSTVRASLQAQIAAQATAPSTDMFQDPACVYELFIVKTVLAPLGASFCKTDLTHPLCQLPDVMLGYFDPEYADLSIGFGKVRGFSAPAPSPAPPPQAPPPRHPPSPYPCGHPGYQGCI